MKPNEVKMTIYKKDKTTNKYIKDGEITYENEVIKSLCEMLIEKKINKCTWIAKITGENLYNGYRRIKVYTQFKYMYEYIVRDH